MQFSGPEPPSWQPESTRPCQVTMAECEGFWGGVLLLERLCGVCLAMFCVLFPRLARVACVTGGWAKRVVSLCDSRIALISNWVKIKPGKGDCRNPKLPYEGWSERQRRLKNTPVSDGLQPPGRYTTRLQPIYFSLFLTDFLLISIHQLEPSRNTTLKHRCRIILLAHLLQELQVLGAV